MHQMSYGPTAPELSIHALQSLILLDSRRAVPRLEIRDSVGMRERCDSSTFVVVVRAEALFQASVIFVVNSEQDGR